MVIAGVFWYQTIDAIDGKHARRTDNCSPLGQLLDHNLDQITFTVIMVSACSVLQVGHNIYEILLITPAVMSAHYSIEYRTHFSGVHYTVVGFIGATEQLLIIMAVMIAAAVSPNTNDFVQNKVTIMDYEMSIRQIIIAFVFISGYHWSGENIVRGFLEARDKIYALKALIPYLEFFIMMYVSSYSRFFA